MTATQLVDNIERIDVDINNDTLHFEIDMIFSNIDQSNLSTLAKLALYSSLFDKLTK